MMHFLCASTVFLFYFKFLGGKQLCYGVSVYKLCVSFKPATLEPYRPIHQTDCIRGSSEKLLARGVPEYCDMIAI
ncbi:hypothetical protein BDP27DRAFT_1332434, partial [Rhodocollybia butyracea]